MSTYGSIGIPERIEAARRLVGILKKIEEFQEKLEDLGMELPNAPWYGIEDVFLDLIGIPSEYQRDNSGEVPPAFNPFTQEYCRDACEEILDKILTSKNLTEPFIRKNLARLMREAKSCKEQGYKDPLSWRAGE